MSFYEDGHPSVGDFMKANKRERNQFDHALDEILELFNNLEDDEPIIHFEPQVLEQVQKAKIKFGAEEVYSKINTICREMLSWLDLDDVQLNEIGNEKNEE